MELFAVTGDDARRFLPAVLEGMQAKGGVGRRVGIIENAEHAAFFAGFVVILVIGKTKRELREVDHGCLGAS
ncbi:hypothetical protein GCM10027256_18610 [Novispirillum itersonii subsp. nipponicum]